MVEPLPSKQKIRVRFPSPAPLWIIPMTYRVLRVDGQDFEYSVGPTNVHIRGVGDVLASTVGEAIYFDDLDETSGHRTRKTAISVRSKKIANWLRAHGHTKRVAHPA